jgi:hypothetical protein
MDIRDLIQGKSHDQEIDVEGIAIPVPALRKLMEEGYSKLRAYRENHTVAVWGKSCTACFTEEQLRKRV